MARLPQVGGDSGNWGDVLNDFLSQAHSSDGTLRAASVSATHLAPNSVHTQAIADAAVTEGKLAAAVQAKLNTTATDGREVELRRGTTDVEWRYVGGSSWTSLIPLSDITGADGQDGQDGTNGTNGIDGQTPDTSMFPRFVSVVSGNESRPGAAGGLVIWVDIRDGTPPIPTNMATGDIVMQPTLSAPPTITTTLISALTVGSSYTQAIGVTGTAPITWSVTAGALPDGLSLNTGTGELAGTPTTSGVFSFTLTATNSAGSDSQAYSGSVEDVPAPGVRTVFDVSAPWVPTVGNDGGGALKVGNRFYTNRPNGITIRGMRLWNPDGAPSPFLTSDVTAYAILGDYTGSVVSETAWNTPTRTKVYTGARTAGSWTEILFDTPVTLSQVSGTAGSPDFVTIAYQIAGGTYYEMASETLLPGNGAVESTAADGVFFAEGSFQRATLTLDGGEPGYEAQDWCWYGVDLIYEVL